MREMIAKASEEAFGTAGRRSCILRLITVAIRDRDLALREQGRERMSDAEIAEFLAKLGHQRERSAAAHESEGDHRKAADDREEAAVIASLRPRCLAEGDMKAACQAAVEETGSTGLRDLGRCMTALKKRYGGQLNMADAGLVVRDLLR